MFKGVKRYVRERLERKVISKSDKVDGLRKPKPARYYRCRASFVPDYLKRVNKNFSYHFLALKHDTQQQSNENNSDEFKSNRCLDPSWVETFGLVRNFLHFHYANENFFEKMLEEKLQ